ncbi:MAG TPA: DUF3516 domain-containing protein, partial [Candidatus Paceibacterota bacterium]|nr:DUF3516 domain-containing protein [Candidatus Paceibacterota bacterium]
NFVNWDKNTFSRLIAAPPERLTSRFQVTHAMLLNVLSRKSDGCAAMQNLIHDCHESPKQKLAHVKRGWQLFRSLVDRKIVEFIDPRSSRREEVQTASSAISSAVSEFSSGSPSSLSPREERVGREPERGASDLSVHSELSASSPRPSPPLGAKEMENRPASLAKVRVNIELQDDFSMDQVLSLYLLETIPLVDPEQPDYALVLLTLVESILENPEIILRKQLDRVKDAKMAEMKMAGVEYDERMEELEKLEYPKPNREFVYSTFNAFADRHPWVGQENIQPKSIVREMFEQFRSFADYIRDYELQRAEGVLLRHLNSVFKVLTQTVPDSAKNEQVREMEVYLGSIIRQVDSSLLDEWEKMRDPNYQRAETKEVRPPGAEEAAADVTRDTKAFTAAIRNKVFTFLRGLVIADYETAIAHLASPLDADSQTWTPDRLDQILQAYEADHKHLCLDPNARNARHTYVTPSEDKKTWRVQQMLVDPEEHNDWVAEFEVDLAESRKLSEPVLRLRRIGSLT